MKKLFIILLSALSLTAFAQSKKTVAVLDPICRDNSVNAFFQQMVRGAMESAVTASAEYEAYDRSAFDMIQKEQAFQRTGAVNDSQIKQLGEMAGVDYVLVSEVSAYEGYLSAVVKILNVTTGRSDRSIDNFMQLNPESVKSKCAEMAASLFGAAPLYKGSVNQDFTKEISEENVKTILVTPENAKIFINGQEVGNGSYTYKFDKKTDFIILKFEAPGYISRSNIRLFKDNPKQTISYTLYEDEAYKQSIRSGDADIANKWITITCKKVMTKDKVWHDLISVASDYFKHFEERDKAAGWIKTAWHEDTFESGQKVRTRLEVRVMIGGEDENELSYKMRISSEKNEDINCTGDECYEKFPRILRKYHNLINDISSLDANN